MSVFIDYVSPVDKRNVKLESVDQNGRKRVSIFGEHQAVGMLNKNYRIYTEELWNDLLSRPDFIEAQNSNRLLGFLGHPDFSKGVYLDYSKFSHYTKNIYREGDVIYATDYPTTSPMGVLLTNYMLEDGIKFGISSRGYGESEQRFDSSLGRHVEVMKPGFVLEGWDFVLDPSCYIAFPKVKLESRQYVENWNPVVKVFRDTVYDYLDRSDVSPEEYVKAYLEHINFLKNYPNQAAVKNYVFESVKKVEDLLHKKVSSSGNYKRYYDNKDIFSSESFRKVFESLKNDAISLAKRYNDLLSKYNYSRKVISAYEKKFRDLLEEVNYYRLEAPQLKGAGQKGNFQPDEEMAEDEGLDMSQLENEPPVGAENMPVEGEEGGIEPGQMNVSDLKQAEGENADEYIDSDENLDELGEGEDIELSDEGSGSGITNLTISQVKKMNLRDVMELGEVLSVLPEEKKQILVSAIFNNSEPQIKNALYELIEQKEESVRREKIRAFMEYLSLKNKYKIENKGSDEDFSEPIGENSSDEQKSKVLKKLSKYANWNSSEMNYISHMMDSIAESSMTFGRGEHALEEDTKYISKPYGSMIHRSIPDRNVLTVRQGDTTSTNYIGNERFSDYIESMSLSNVNSPYQCPSYLLVTKNYEHPASSSHLRKGEEVLYLGYFKGNWDYKLEDIAVLRVNYMLMGNPVQRYVTILLNDLYKYTVPFSESQGSKESRDENLPFSGYVDQDGNENSGYYNPKRVGTKIEDSKKEDIYLYLDSQLQSKPLDEPIE